MGTTSESRADRRSIGPFSGRLNPAKLYFVAAAGLTLAALAIQITTRDAAIPPAWGFRGFAITLSAAFSLVGLVVALRNSQNLIGWLLLTAGFITALQALVFEYAVLALLAKPGVLAGGALFAWLNGWMWVLGMGLSTTFVLLLFPEGRLPSRKWVPVAWISALSIAFAVIGLATIPGDSPSFGPVQNPVAVGVLADKPWLFNIALIPLLGSIVASASSLVVRYKNTGSDVERHQLKWFALAGVLLASAAVLNQVDIAVRGDSVNSNSTDVLVVIGALTIPLAIGIAVLRYRLYDIDLIISRTLVYGPLTATLAGTYTASIIFFRLLFVDVLSVSSDAAVASTTLLLAALFVPARNRIQALVDRFFKEDEYRRLMTFSKEAANAADLMSQDVVARRFLSLAIAATGASGCKIALDGTGQGVKEYAEGSLGSTGGVVLPLHADGRQVGRLELGAPPNGNRFRDAELDSVNDAANLVARSLAFHDMR